MGTGDAKLDLLHERQEFFLRAADRQSRCFPGEEAAFEIARVRESQCLQFFLCFRTALAAATGDDQWLAAIDFRDPALDLAERDELGSGDVLLGVLNWLANVDQAAAGGHQRFEIDGADGFGGKFHGDGRYGCLISSRFEPLYRHIAI